MTLYTHPTLRGETYENALKRLEDIRAMRVLQAVEFRNVQDEKNRAATSKFSKQWFNLSARIEKRLINLEEACGKLDEDLRKLQDLSNKVALYSEDE